MIMRFTFLPTIVCLFCSCLMSTNRCRADVVYSDLAGPLQNGGVGIIGAQASLEMGYGASDQVGTQLFQSSGNFALTSVTVATSYFPGQPGVQPPGGNFSPDFDVWLYSNYQYAYEIHGFLYYANQPASPLEEVAQNLVSPAYIGLVTANSSVDSTQLEAGTLYWIVLTPANPYTIVTWESDGLGRALEVDGTVVTPEPATFGLSAVALGAVILFGGRKRWGHSVSAVPFKP